MAYPGKYSAKVAPMATVQQESYGVLPPLVRRPKTVVESPLEAPGAAFLPGPNTPRIDPASVSVAPPPKPERNTTDEEKLAQLNELLRTHEIRPDFLQRLLQLDEYEIVFILDDSYSMWGASDVEPHPRTFIPPSYAGTLRYSGISGNSASSSGEAVGNPDNYSQFWSRWEELKHIIKILIPIANVFDNSGVDLYFFGKEPIFNYTGPIDSISAAEYRERFSMPKPPLTEFEKTLGTPMHGSTPLTNTVNRVLKDNKQKNMEKKPEERKKLLIFIITDGEPTEDDNNKYTAIRNFKQALIDKGEDVYVSILACTGDQYAIGYLNDIDDTVPRVDCIDDYKSEKKEILSAQGNGFLFSYGDYIIKSVLGSVDTLFDSLDEMNLLHGAYICKSNEHHSVKKGASSMVMVSDVRKKWQEGNTKWREGSKIMLKTPTNIGTYDSDIVTITSITDNGKTITFTPVLQHNHYNYITECMPGSNGCLPSFWGGRTRRRPNKSRNKRRSNKSRNKRRV